VLKFREQYPSSDIVILGYSRDGNTAVQFANVLGSSEIPVKALVTFDPHRRTDGGFRLGQNNVESALNFYQQNPTDRGFGLLSFSASNPYTGSQAVGAKNFLLPDANHLNIICRVLADEPNRSTTQALRCEKSRPAYLSYPLARHGARTGPPRGRRAYR
jgi:hypothetical protein